MEPSSPAPVGHTGFTVYVDENSHYRDEEERYTKGVYPTYEEALSIAKSMLEQDLHQSLENGKTATEWLDLYFTFGEDPWISPTPDGVAKFSAWDYARELAKQKAPLS
ncbi:hypothetical protein DES53_102317 [Roseimicrobium gellanilyticum]|uniref:Uncharacterized protein n=1 Tax=Roseimicrobium gellanilyticum TaxID=748857 RepID=A0A366HSP3_9BACT|nr:hypothetical protein [Roseimicrobium gellanilyticum]RBP45933.1 hypothetical protein DES53_102317 [Roseimicrobium gellanilyticum]